MTIIQPGVLFNIASIPFLLAQAQTGQFADARRAMAEAVHVAEDVMRRLPEETLSSEYFAEVANHRARLFEISNEPAALRRSCREALAVLGAHLDHRSIYNDSRRAKLLLCAGRGEDAAPLLGELDRMGYRDPYLDRWRGVSRSREEVEQASRGAGRPPLGVAMQRLRYKLRAPHLTNGACHAGFPPKFPHRQRPRSHGNLVAYQSAGSSAGC